MKRFFFILLPLLLITAVIQAQQKSERFCKLFIITYLHKEKGLEFSEDYIKLYSGKILVPFDSSEIKKLAFVDNFKSDIDALNFMKMNGWELVTSTFYQSPFINELGRKEFYFKKLF